MSPTLFLLLGCVFIDSLTDMNEGAVLDCEIILLQFILDVFDQPFISDISQFFFKLTFFFIINYWNEDFVDESQTVVAHENVVCVKDGLGKRFKKRWIVALFFEKFQTLQNCFAVLNFPSIILKHQKYVCGHCDIHRMICS